jgi:hypothetical protein
MSNAKWASALKLTSLLCLSGLLLVAPLKAQDQPPSPDQMQNDQFQPDSTDQNDPPSRVARLSYLDGSVSLQPGGEGDWGSAAKNRPITIADKIWVDKDSRAELQAGQASIHLGTMTALSFLNLDEAITQMRLAEGSINFRVRELREGDLYEVDTPNLAFTVKQAGAFRIDVSENGDGTRITVLRGEGEVLAGGKTYEGRAGERAEFAGMDNDVRYSAGKAPGPDSLDRWSSERDLREDNSVSAKYVSRDTPGYSDLDDNGTWSEVPEYGHVWYPSAVDVGWAPYSYGYWSSIGPWGWTWIDYSPWGFAPYHYGRWNLIGGRWGWCPGPIYARPFYGPAFVGFYGGGFGAGFGFGFGGGVGWFPLGFGEPFHPWFHGGRRFVNNINIHNTVIRNTTIINNNHFNYAYAHNTRAVTVASRSAFANGERINRGSVRVTDASLRGAQVTHNPGVNPTRQSNFGAAHAGGRVSTPPSAVQNRQVVARTAPSAATSHMVRGNATAGFGGGRSGNSPQSGAISRQGNGGFNRGGSTTSNSGPAARDRQLAMNRPPSARSEVSRNSSGGLDRAANSGANRPSSARSEVSRNSSGGFDRAANSSPNRPSSRTWDAQGNSTDRGRPPQGFGRNNSPAQTPSNRPNTQPQTGRPNGQVQRSDRPAWAGSGSNGPRSAAPNYSGNRPANNGGGNRSYSPPQRSYSPPQQRSYSPPSRGNSAPNRSYSAPSRSYSPPSRTYSAPSRSYPAPSRSNSAPSRSYSGGGGSGNRGGGGSPHGGGGSTSHTRH